MAFTPIVPSYPLTVVDGQVYALPPKAVQVTVLGTAGTVAVSNDNSTFVTMTLDSNKNFQTSAAFLKITSATPTILARPL